MTNMMYARNRKDAEDYIAENFDGYEVYKTGIACACGESEGYVIRDSEGEEVENIVVCEACWHDAAYADRIG